PAADKRGERFAGAAAARIVDAVAAAALVEFRRIDAAQPDTLGSERDGISIIDDDGTCQTARLGTVEPEREQDQKAEDRESEQPVPKPAPPAARTRRTPSPAAPGGAHSHHMANNLLIIPP